LLALALQDDLRIGQLTAIFDAAVIDEAVDTGVALVDADRVRPAHPLLAAAAMEQVPEKERLELHRALAGVVRDEELRCLHLALATKQADDELAGAGAHAAAAASGRGAAQPAGAPAQHALRVPPHAPA